MGKQSEENFKGVKDNSKNSGVRSVLNARGGRAMMVSREKRKRGGGIPFPLPLLKYKPRQQCFGSKNGSD